MQPRLATSKKWTAFPKEYQEKITEVFTEAFASQMSGEHFEIDGRFYTKELFLKVTLCNDQSLANANFLISMDFNSQKENAIEKIYVAIDALASFIDQYFVNNRETIDFPRVWDKIDFEKKEVHILFSPANEELEAQADALLGEASKEKSLVQGEDFEEDLDVLKKTIGIDDDSGDESH